MSSGVEWAHLAGRYTGVAEMGLRTHEWNEPVMAELVAEFERLISAATPTDVTAEHADRGE